MRDVFLGGGIVECRMSGDILTNVIFRKRTCPTDQTDQRMPGKAIGFLIKKESSHVSFVPNMNFTIICCRKQVPVSPAYATVPVVLPVDDDLTLKFPALESHR